MYSPAGLRDKMHRIRSNGATISRVIVAINVGCDSDGVYYISDERRQGVHWAVLIIDVNCGKTYYAMRYRPISESTKDKYYDLFRQGHSPSSAHLEYETHLTYMDDPKLLADIA